MRRLCQLLPLINVVFFAAVAVIFVAQHEGWHGDVRFENDISDVVTGDDGLIVYNRWRLVADRESPFTKAFIIANAPAFGAAKLLVGVVESFGGWLQSPYPFGLSYPSYTITLGLLLSLVQWFGIGALWDSLHRRFRKRGDIAVR